MKKGKAETELKIRLIDYLAAARDGRSLVPMIMRQASVAADWT